MVLVIFSTGSNIFLGVVEEVGGGRAHPGYGSRSNYSSIENGNTYVLVSLIRVNGIHMERRQNNSTINIYRQPGSHKNNKQK